MGYNTSRQFDDVAHLKNKSMRELIVMRNDFTDLLRNNKFSMHHRFVSYLSLIELEIASRIGKKK